MASLSLVKTISPWPLKKRKKKEKTISPPRCPSMTIIIQTATKQLNEMKKDFLNIAQQKNSSNTGQNVSDITVLFLIHNLFCWHGVFWIDRGKDCKCFWSDDENKMSTDVKWLRAAWNPCDDDDSQQETNCCQTNGSGNCCLDGGKSTEEPEQVSSYLSFTIFLRLSFPPRLCVPSSSFSYYSCSNSSSFYSFVTS